MPSPPPVDALRDRVAARLFTPPDAPADARGPAGVPPGTPAAIARFEVLRVLGAGGMGTVYLCRDPMLAREVAVKVMHPRFDRDEQTRALAEARALATLAHPNVVPVFEVGEFEERTFLAMERVDGVSLREWTQSRDGGPARASWVEVVRIHLQAAAGLGAAHRAGIVHRDFKPANVLLGNDGRVRVLDFGLARTTASAEVPKPVSRDSPDSPSGPGRSTISSRSHTLAGTPAYMAPEQLRGGPVDARADQWSFCVSLWEALYGTRPFPPEPVRAAADRGELPRPQAAHERGPSAVRRILLRGLALRPDDRWPSIDELATALDGVLRRRRTRTSLGLAAFACIGAAGVAGGWAAFDPCERDDAHLDGVWGDAERRGAIAQLDELPAGLHDAAAWWVARLDAQREGWLVAEHMACRAAHERPDDETIRDARACLLRARASFADVVAATRDAPERVLLRLPGARTTEDPLLEVLDVPARCLEHTDARRRVSDELWRDLAASKALLASGDPDGARLRAEQTLDRAQREQSDGGEMLARSLLGAIDLDEGWTARAVSQFERAVGLAEATRDDRESAILWLALVDAALMHLHDADIGERSFARADAAVARVGVDDDLRFRLERARGVLASMRDDDVAAISAFDRAAQAAAFSGADGRRERLALDRGNHELARGRVDAARRFFDEAGRMRAARIGSDHPSLHEVELALGRAAKLEENHPVARGHFARAAELIEQAFGAHSPRLSSALAGLGEALLSTGDLDEAERVALRTAAVQAELPPTHPDRGGGLALLGMLAEVRGQASIAASWYLAAADAQSGLSTAAQRLEAVNNAAWHLNRVGRADEARPLYHWLETHTDEGSQMHAFALAGAGRSTHLLGDAQSAVVALEAARLAASRLTQPHPQLMPEIEWHLAAALHDAGIESTRSRTLAQGSLQRYEAEWPDQADTIADLRRLATDAIDTSAPPEPDGT